MSENIPNPENQSTRLLERITEVQKYALENRATVGSYTALIIPFTNELKTQFSQEELDGSYSWHKLIGSTPPPDMDETDSSVTAVIDQEISGFVSTLEEQWLTPEGSPDEMSTRIDRLYDHVAETRDLEKNSQFNQVRESLREALISEFPPHADGTSQLKGIPAWEKLIGGSEIETVTPPEVRESVTARVEELVSQLEADWGLKN